MAAATAPKFVVGIDLGTTHTVVAYAAFDARRTKTPPAPRVLSIPQLTSASELEALPLLPSCLYAPVEGEVSGDPDWVLGELARRRGAEVTGRAIVSAKSWLSHASVDRLAPILPWGEGDATVPRLSPVDASARILAHVRQAWDEAHPGAKLEDQEVVLTLPASFDEVARELTLRAAETAGLRPSLLEEPTAAFYDAMREGQVAKLTREGEEKRVLVCDVGGGTTDLSLMAVTPDASSPAGFRVRRVAVGRHILLGGDNMDLALAHLAEGRVAPPPQRLEAAELAQLVLACRHAKERILSGEADEARVAVLGRGSKLVGGARATTLTRNEVERVVLSGFFPADVGTEAARRGAIVAFGLPYERDPAITRHVRQFLARHENEIPRGVPDALLLNGGVFLAKPIVSALADALASWAPSRAAPVLVPSPDPDLAVARGAVLYGFARLGLGVKVESGASRGYYVALAPEREGGALTGLCVLPRGAKEGVRYEAGRKLDLLVGRSVRFDVYASDVARDEAGALATIDADRFERLPPVVAHLPASGKEESVPVTLGGELLETGQLELACIEAGGRAEGARAEKRRFRLAFQLREGGAPPPSLAPPTLAPSTRPSAAPSKLGEAERVLERVFAKRADASPREVKDVVRDLEKVLGERPSWSMDVTRAIVDKLLVNPGARRRSPAHERAFWLLLGYGLRPGFGDPGDPARIARAWPLFEGRLAFPDEPRGQAQFFIAWRRMAGGLDEAMQSAFRDAMDPLIAPPEARLKKPKRPLETPDELLATLASFERVPASRRVTLGEWLVERTWTSDDPRLWAAIGRVGARVPLYASVHHVVPAAKAEAWLERLLRVSWDAVPTAPHAAVQLARLTGDRARDVAPRLRDEVARRLEAARAKESWVRAVRELEEVGEEERVAILGEGLPIGLRLSTS